MSDNKREIGLKAITGARDDRQRAKYGRITNRVWLFAGGALLLTVLVAWLISGRSLSSERSDLLAQQRAAVKTVGAEWMPLRDRLETLTVEAAGAYKGDLVDPEASKWDFRSSPGLYLRLRVEDATSVDSLRKRARESLKDAFTTCLLREPNPAMAALVRGDADAGAGYAEQPWNLRQAYTSTRVLEPEWAREVEAAGDELRLRVFAQQYDKAKREEIPLAIDIVKRAQFYLLVLDEDVPEAKEIPVGDAGAMAALQQVPHPSRVHIVNLKTGKELVRLRRVGDADAVGAAAGGPPLPQEVRAAMKRQVNNCNLASQVLAAISPDGKR